MQNGQHSDWLPWTLAVVALLIMAAAVRINADETSPASVTHEPSSAKPALP